MERCVVGREAPSAGTLSAPASTHTLFASLQLLSAHAGCVCAWRGSGGCKESTGREAPEWRSVVWRGVEGETPPHTHGGVTRAQRKEGVAEGEQHAHDAAAMRCEHRMGRQTHTHCAASTRLRRRGGNAQRDRRGCQPGCLVEEGVDAVQTSVCCVVWGCALLCIPLLSRVPPRLFFLFFFYFFFFFFLLFLFFFSPPPPPPSSAFSSASHSVRFSSSVFAGGDHPCPLSCFFSSSSSLLTRGCVQRVEQSAASPSRVSATGRPAEVPSCAPLPSSPALCRSPSGAIHHPGCHPRLILSLSLSLSSRFPAVSVFFSAVSPAATAALAEAARTAGSDSAVQRVHSLRFLRVPRPSAALCLRGRLLSGLLLLRLCSVLSFFFASA